MNKYLSKYERLAEEITRLIFLKIAFVICLAMLGGCMAMIWRLEQMK